MSKRAAARSRSSFRRSCSVKQRTSGWIRRWGPLDTETPYLSVSLLPFPSDWVGAGEDDCSVCVWMRWSVCVRVCDSRAMRNYSRLSLCQPPCVRGRFLFTSSCRIGAQSHRQQSAHWRLHLSILHVYVAAIFDYSEWGLQRVYLRGDISL